MPVRFAPTLLALATSVVLSHPGSAQDTLGRIEYIASCAQCHGPAARGDGPIAPMLTIPPPDLTQLQRANGGVFPFSRVYGVIADGGGIAAHGASDMPAWGARFVVDTYLRDGVRVPIEEQDAFVSGRILALIDHLAAMQEN